MTALTGWWAAATGFSFTLRQRARPSAKMLNDRLREALDLPSDDFQRAFSRQWEYQQADTSVAWESEPNFEALSAALAEYEETPEAFARLLDLAAAGSVVAMTTVGEAYYWGSGISIDSAEAENWLRKAFELGSRRGLLSYGRVLYLRDDLAVAEQIFRKGAAAGWPEAKYRLADIIIQRAPGKSPPAEVGTLIEAAADAGHPFARQWHGRAVVRGRYGVARLPKAFRLLWAVRREMRRAWELRASKPVSFS